MIWIDELEKQLTLVPVYKLPNRKFKLYDSLIRQNVLTSGDILEFGVAEGHSIRWFTSNFPDSDIYGFDSFYGLPEEWDLGKKVYPVGHFSTEGATPNFEGPVWVKGLFEDTLPSFFKDYNGFAKIINIDCDLYSSTSLVLKYIYPILKEGTLILFDELTYFDDHPKYSFVRKHEYKAFSEFINKHPNFKYEVLGRTTGPTVLLKVLSL